jgi:hypothetical protein
MANINRRTKFRPGSLSPELLADNGALVWEDGKVSAQPLLDADLQTNTRIDNIYWKDPVNSVAQLEDLDPDTLRPGDSYYSITEQQVYVFSGPIPSLPQNIDTYQPPAWTAANRTEYFFPVAVGLDKDSLATKSYVDSEILNLIDNAPGVLDTIRELAEAINNDENFADNVFAQITGLQNTKADKSSVYTTQKIDQIEADLLQIINAIDAKNRRLVDYIIGNQPYADNVNLQDQLTFANLPTSQEPLTYLLRQGSIATDPVLSINNPGYIFLAPAEETVVFPADLRIELSNTTSDDFILFKDITLSSILIPSSSSSFTLILDNVTLNNELQVYSNINLIIQNSQLIDVSTVELSNSSITKISNSNIKNDNRIFETSNSALLMLNNSHVSGELVLRNDSKLYSNDVSFETLTNSTIIIANDTDTLVSLKDIEFITPVSYSANYIDGLGDLYCNLNVYDSSLNNTLNQDQSYTKQIKVSSTLNGNQGMQVQHYYLPNGYEHFFYNDEKARDTIADFISAHTLNHSAVSWIHDDTNDTFSLQLNLSTSDLSDQQDIAFKSKENIFTQRNVFDAVSVNSATINIADINTASIDLLTIPTQLQTDSSNKAATTQYVREAFSQLEADIEDLELHELKDVSISSPAKSHVVVYNPNASTISETWFNKQLDSSDLSNDSELVKAGDSVFRLTDIARPALFWQSGSAGSNSGYSSTNQTLRWNGDQYDIQGTITKGNGQWVVDLSNNSLLKAAQEPTTVSDYDGWGKIALADYEEVRDGTNSTKAVVPSLLHTYYASSTLSNLSNLAISRENLGFQNLPHYYKYDLDTATIVNTSYTYPGFDSVIFDQAASGLNSFNLLDGKYYFLTLDGTQNLLLNLTSLFPFNSSVKIRKESLAGTYQLVINQNEYFLTSDNIKVYNTLDLINQYQDITITKLQDSSLVTYWKIAGYYQNSNNSSTAPIDIEATQDAVAPLFINGQHSPALSFVYDDPNHRINTTLNFATEAQALAGIIEDKPISPKTLQTAIQASTPTGVLFADNNLSDLANTATARSNLGLGSAALTNIGFSVGDTPRVGSSNLIVNQALIYDGTGIVSTTMSLGGGSYTTATTLNEGIVTLAKVSDPVSSENAATPKWFYETISSSSPNVIQSTLKSLSGSAVYQPMNYNFKAEISHYYSISTTITSGNIEIDLPECSLEIPGTKIEFKYRQQYSNNIVTIIPYSVETIDRDPSPFILNEEGQFITFVAGFDGNWEIH